MNIRPYFTYLIALWIAFFEGYWKPGSRASQNNNPGNLRSWGDRPTLNGFAFFETPADGFLALIKQVNKNIDRGLTLQEFFAGKPGVYPGYAPAADDNDPENYASFISKKTGIPLADVPIKQFIEDINQRLT
jgi:hypothetical protein